MMTRKRGQGDWPNIGGTDGVSSVDISMASSTSKASLSSELFMSCGNRYGRHKKKDIARQCDRIAM